MDKVKVSIIMGSDSDLKVMSEASKCLEEFNIAYEMDIVSAHRTPQKMFDYALHAHERGIKVIIAGAGGAAHLPGMVAAISPLPVVGVPIKSSSLGGTDSLLSIAQMPGGVPVATVAINGAKNAALLAIQILATSDKGIQKKIIQYKNSLKQSVEEKSIKLRDIKYKEYLKSIFK